MHVSWIHLWKEFLKNNPLLNVVKEVHMGLPQQVRMVTGNDAEFWDTVATSFPAQPDIINLNNGAVSSSPLITEQAFTAYYRLLNTSPSYFTWKIMEPGRELIRAGLAKLINADKEEVAILRNATEALNNAILGIPLTEGDEVVLCKQDYTKTIASWTQRQFREKIHLVWVDLSVEDSDATIVEKYSNAFSAKTKVLQLTHVINWTGLVMPVEPIINEAKKRNLKVVLDGAHSFGILETDVVKLRCDYFVTALHKWLSGPIPSGLLYVKKENIGALWPLSSAAEPMSDNIRKFEELSIQSLPMILGLGHSIYFHLKLGRENKEARVRYLRKYWVDQLKEIKGVSFNTPFEEPRCCVIVNISLHNFDPLQLERILLNEYHIHVGTVILQGFTGIRITPNIYTAIKDLDKFIAAMHAIATKT